MMKKLTVLIVFTLLVSCSSDNENSGFFEINGLYTNEITDCSFSENPEINCTEFVNFRDESTANLLLGGSDIVIVANYQIIDNSIEFEQIESVNIEISFVIIDTTSLRRIETGDIWLKSE